MPCIAALGQLREGLGESQGGDVSGGRVHRATLQVTAFSGILVCSLVPALHAVRMPLCPGRG